MISRKEVVDILCNKFGSEEGRKILEYLEAITQEKVATQKDIYELKLKIEKVRAELTVQIEKVRADLIVEIEKNRTEIEKVHADLMAEIEKNRTEAEKVRAELIKWSFLFWITQMAVLVGILYKLLS
ncbi:MAG TPA: DUF1640 domain-containing protein [Methanosarcinales archaeon]|nr:DUF1640 domain-containing protein [Methanosarcinales archaeon]